MGAATVGGDVVGRTIYTVTNLNDSGAGSLRAALTASGARLVVGDPTLCGTIELTTDISITNGSLTWDFGGCANGGVQVKGANIDIRASEVIFRYVKIRPGLDVPNPATNNAIHVLRTELVEATSKIVLDHCSLGWTGDQIIDVESQQVTMQWCMLYELQEGSGTLLHYYGAATATYHHNLLANSPGARAPEQGTGDVQFVNNVIYRNQSFVATGLHFQNLASFDPGCVLDSVGPSGCDGPDSFTEGGVSRTDYIKNFFKMGLLEKQDDDPADYKQVVLLGRRRFAADGAHGGLGPSSFYALGNIGPARPTDNLPQSDIYEDGDASDGYPYPISGSRIFTAIPSETSAAQAYTDVLAGAGAREPCFDSVDSELITNVMNGTGSVNAHESNDFDWPDLTVSCIPPPNATIQGTATFSGRMKL